MEFLRDPVWQFVGAVIGLIGLVATILLARRKKRLSYRIRWIKELVSVDDAVRGSVKVSFNDAPVEKVHFVALSLYNTGGLSISKTDYETPISIQFGEQSQVLTASVGETRPKNLPVKLGITEKTVTLEPILLNPGDSLLLSCLVNRLDQKNIGIHGRIVGLSDIKVLPDSDSTRKQARILRFVGFVFYGCGLLIVGRFCYSLSQLHIEIPTLEVGLFLILMSNPLLYFSNRLFGTARE